MFRPMTPNGPKKPSRVGDPVRNPQGHRRRGQSARLVTGAGQDEPVTDKPYSKNAARRARRELAALLAARKKNPPRS